jgi:transcriptional regulator with XRE-family HTH domain
MEGTVTERDVIFVQEQMLVDIQCEFNSAMADCGFDRDQLANRMGVDVDAVNHLFAEDARPSLGLLAEVAEALGCEIRFSLMPMVKP